MARNPLDVAALLQASFTKAEREFLNAHPTFVSQLEKATTADDYEKLRDLSEELLKSEHRSNPAAQQFRRDARQGR